jgi:NAD(P)H-hydrate epimerase
MNIKTAILDVGQAAEADRLAVADGISLHQLMENAGRAVAREIQRRWSARSTVVLCGPGNNGGDGLVVARLLVEAGWHVRVALLGSGDGLPTTALDHPRRWSGSVEPLIPDALDGAEIVVDAIFGAGLDRPLAGGAGETLAAASRRSLIIVSIDVPSGLMGDTGESLGAVSAALTVTFSRKKPAHLLLPGRLLCGELVVADIGIPSSVLPRIKLDTFENDPVLWLTDMPQLREGGNKYTRGHALISGGYPITGAPRMAARIGAGLTTIAIPELAMFIYASSLTSVMVHPLEEASDFDSLLNDHRFSALLIGPGAGVGKETRERVFAMLASHRPVVLDADAIMSFQDDPAALNRAIVGHCVLTPHDGEFRALFEASADKLARTRAAARHSGAIIVLKGADTVIASPNGQAIINTNAPPTLATAGSGDVLSGILVGLLAQGMEPFLAAAAAVWVHGAAANDFGPGLIAEDLPDLLPGVLQRLHSLVSPDESCDSAHA